MLISARPHSIPKAGSTNEEYEDAYYPLDPIDDNKEFFSFAVADGATETSYSKFWAQLLVESYCNGQINEPNLAEQLLKLQAKWNEAIGSRPLPWYAEEKIRTGAFSSILGLTIKQEVTLHNVQEGAWEALAVGDSCLFQVRDDELLNKFPLENSEEFNSRPVLVSTNSLYNENLENHVLRLEGNWKAGDEFYLFTDAIACWFLKEVENGRKPWLFKYKAADLFEDKINKLRETGSLRNDDVTMIHIELLSDSTLE